MRRFISLFAALILLLPASLAAADTEWAKENLPYVRQPVPIEVVPWDELPPANPDQHHYLLLCIDQ